MSETQESIPVKKIQTVSALKINPGRAEAEIYDAEKYSPHEQAEHLWGFYADYRRQEARIKREAIGETKIVDRASKPETAQYVKGPLKGQWDLVLAEQKKLAAAQEKCGYFYQGGKLFSRPEIKPAVTDIAAYKKSYGEAVGTRSQFDRQLLNLVAKDPEAQKTIKKIQLLWGKPETQKIFRESYAEADKQNLKQKKEAAKYGFLKQFAGEARNNFFQLLHSRYINGREAPMTLQVDLDLAEDRLGAAEEAAAGVIKPENPTRETADRAALAKHLDLREYARDFQTKNFIWSPSRLKLLNTITKHLANMVPTLLVGEAGSGKTQLARTAVTLLQGESPRSVTGAPFTPAKAELAGVHEIGSGGQTSWTFGELVAAATGFQGSEEMKGFLNQFADGIKKAGAKTLEATGSIIFIDEANLFDPGAFESYIKSIVGLRPKESFRMGALPGVALRIAEKGFGMILAINQADARYSNRNEFPPSLARLFRNGHTIVDYPEMEIGQVNEGRQDNKCELFDMLLASLMTREGRVLLSPSQIQPVYEKVEVDKAAGTHTMVIDMAKENFLDFTEEEAGRNSPKRKISKEPNHGALFRFALLVRATNDLFSEKNVVLPGESKPLSNQDKLTYTVLDLGVVMTWMKELGNRAGVDLNYELWQRLQHFSQTIPKMASEDARVFKKLAAAYGFDLNLKPELRPKPYNQVLTEKETGFLSPEVPRPILQKGEEAGPKHKAFFDPEGNQHLVDVNPLTVELEDGVHRTDFSEGSLLSIKIGTSTRNLFFLGTDQTTSAVILSESATQLQKPMRLPRDRFEQLVKAGNVGHVFRQP
jgi:energy-coupling factor transporter ATP-binding protein EcfA2